MTATDATLDGLLRDVIAHPGDDAVRLIYADRLEELAAMSVEPCPRCSKYADHPDSPFGGSPGYHPERDPASGRHEGGWTNCKACNGGGRGMVRPGFVLATNGFAERAEFVRVQVELAARRSYAGDDARRWSVELQAWMNFLRRRERELFERHADGWLPEVPDLGISVDLLDASWRCCANVSYADSRVKVTGDMRFYFDRGFASEWWGPAADWLTHADALYAVTPIRDVRLTTWPDVDEDEGADGSSWWMLRGTQISRPWPYFDRAAHVPCLLAAAWPGIRFALPGRRE